MPETCRIALPIHGEKLYQRRARQCLPLLIRQAEANQPITYEALASELGMPNPRNLNYVLGSIGQTLIQLGEAWNLSIPALQSLVINKGTHLPGAGIWPLIGGGAKFAALSSRQKREVMKAERLKVHVFPEWHRVLEACGLNPPAPAIPAKTEIEPSRPFGGEGESEDHRRLKEHVAQHPELLRPVIDIPTQVKGLTEFALPSGDAVDVVFRWGKHLVAVEVKSIRSCDSDLERGLFQCVKYQAVLDAWMKAKNCQDDVCCVLVLEGELPSRLVPLQNVLGLNVLSGVARS